MLALPEGAQYGVNFRQRWLLVPQDDIPSRVMLAFPKGSVKFSALASGDGVTPFIWGAVPRGF